MRNLILSIGTYEGGLLVYSLNIELGFHRPLFTSSDATVMQICKMAQGCIKSIEIAKGLVITAGKDEVVRTYKLKTKTNDNVLYGHLGTINKLLVKDDFIFSSSSDGRILIHGLADKKLYDKISAHTKNVDDFDIHSSSRLLVTCAGDKKLKLWNLLDLKEIYHKNVQKCKVCPLSEFRP